LRPDPENRKAVCLERNSSALVEELCLFCRYHYRTDAGQRLIGALVPLLLYLQETVIP
jgi:hypothetical protein